jgi:hypothetical protein
VLARNVTMSPRFTLKKIEYNLRLSKIPVDTKKRMNKEIRMVVTPVRKTFQR